MSSTETVIDQGIITLLCEMERYSDQAAQRMIHYNRQVRRLMKQLGIVYNDPKLWESS